MSKPPFVGSKKHHYVSACLLAQFTPALNRYGDLWAWDLWSPEKEPRTSKPHNEATKNKLNTLWLEDSEGAPVPSDLLETEISKVENSFKDVLDWINQHRKIPYAKHYYDVLISYLALLVVQLPRARKQLGEIHKQGRRQYLEMVLKTPQGWERLIQDNAPSMGLSIEEMDELRTGYEQTKKGIEEGIASSLKLPPNTVIQAFLEHQLCVFELLRWRNALMLRSSGSHHFICSDNPTRLMWRENSLSREKIPGFAFLGTDFCVPLSAKYAFIWRSRQELKIPEVTDASEEQIGRFNLETICHAERHIYSQERDFFLLLPNGKQGTIQQAMEVRREFIARCGAQMKNVQMSDSASMVVFDNPFRPFR